MAIIETTVEGGKIRGTCAGIQSVSVFKGVPFAAPPVGNLRWKEPQPVIAWDGVHNAFDYSPIPMQMRVPKGSFYQKEFYPYDLPMSEDCLYLNIWTPAIKKDEKLPVMLWIFGGGFRQGYSNKMELDGEALANQGVVYVSINYRLGPYGFLAHPELSAESGGKGSGNYGLLDQVAALKWVRRNIEAFGGDPDCITIFGQSAGAMSVQTLTSSPLTKGDIKRAIFQSGGGIRGAGTDLCVTLDTAEREGENFLQELGVTDIMQARKLSEHAVLDAFIKSTAKANGAIFFRPNVDGYLLTKDSSTIALSGEHHDIDYMVGSTSNESATSANNTLPLELYRKKLQVQLGDQAEKYLETAGVHTEEDASAHQNTQMTDDMLYGTLAWCELQNKKGRRPSYRYFFDYNLPGDDNMGAFHSCEHWFVFRTLQRAWRPFTGVDYDFALKVSAYWVNFAKTGNPNGKGLPEWTPFTVGSPKTMCLNPNMAMQELPIAPKTRLMADLALGSK